MNAEDLIMPMLVAVVLGIVCILGYVVHTMHVEKMQCMELRGEMADGKCRLSK